MLRNTKFVWALPGAAWARHFPLFSLPAASGNRPAPGPVFPCLGQAFLPQVPPLDLVEVRVEQRLNHRIRLAVVRDDDGLLLFPGACQDLGQPPHPRPGEPGQRETGGESSTT